MGSKSPRWAQGERSVSGQGDVQGQRTTRQKGSCNAALRCD
jgi:hypothetical protein